MGTPGFHGSRIIAIANAKGLNAPRTNVARSGLEVTPERDALLSTIYKAYCNHVEREILALHTKGAFSLTWATQEAMYLLSPLIRTDKDRVKLVNPELFAKQIEEIPVLVVEKNGVRAAVSPRTLRREPHFWTIDCESFRSAEAFIKEAPAGASLLAVLRAVDVATSEVPKTSILCESNIGHSNLIKTRAFAEKEVDRIILHRAERRVDLRWAPMTYPQRWLNINPSELGGLPWSLVGSQLTEMCVGQVNIEIEGLENEVAIRASGVTYILEGNYLAQFLLQHPGGFGEFQKPLGFQEAFVLRMVVRALDDTSRSILYRPEDCQRFIDFERPWTTSGDTKTSTIDLDAFCQILNDIRGRLFDTRAWVRGKESG